MDQNPNFGEMVQLFPKLLRFGRSVVSLAILLLLCSCLSQQDKSSTIVSMQMVDRNTLTETISNEERLKTYQTVDFLEPQPYEKILRVYGKNRSGQNLSKLTTYHPNGHVKQYLEIVDGRAHGLYREWFANGKLHIEAPVVEGTADITDLAKASWVFHGLCQIWDEQGSLLAKIPYTQGVLHSPSIYFHPNGAIEQIFPYQKGDLHGLVQRFDLDGSLLEEIPYSLGKKQGHAHGKLYTEEYQEGLLLSGTYYNAKGESVATVSDGAGKKMLFAQEKPLALFSIEKGVEEGSVEFFSPDGTLHLRYFVHEGKKEGEEIEFFPGSTQLPKLSLHWHDDKIQGQVKTWYPNGQLESQKEMNDNKKQGLSFIWYKNGDLMCLEEYDNDLLWKGSYFPKGDKEPSSQVRDGEGVATLYTSDGSFLRKIHYEKGKPSDGPAFFK